MTPSTSILMIIFFFLIFPLVLAEFARNRSLPTLEDFFVQSRKMPSVMVFFTVYSTWISVFAFLGASAYFYSKGPVYMTTIGWDVLFGILFMILGRRIWQYGKSREVGLENRRFWMEAATIGGRIAVLLARFKGEELRNVLFFAMRQNRREAHRLGLGVGDK